MHVSLVQVSLRMRVRVSYSAQGSTFQDTVQIDSIPTAACEWQLSITPPVLLVSIDQSNHSTTQTGPRQPELWNPVSPLLIQNGHSSIMCDSCQWPGLLAAEPPDPRKSTPTGSDLFSRHFTDGQSLHLSFQSPPLPPYLSLASSAVSHRQAVNRCQDSVVLWGPFRRESGLFFVCDESGNGSVGELQPPTLCHTRVNCLCFLWHKSWVPIGQWATGLVISPLLPHSSVRFSPLFLSPLHHEAHIGPFRWKVWSDSGASVKVLTGWCNAVLTQS